MSYKLSNITSWCLFKTDLNKVLYKLTVDLLRKSVKAFIDTNHPFIWKKKQLKFQTINFWFCNVNLRNNFYKDYEVE